jgi:hypothetical protein
MSGFIYKITCNDTNERYVGSTVQSLNDRISNHRTHAKEYRNGIKKEKPASIDIIERNNYKAEILEAVNFGEDKDQLLWKEREWMEKLNPVNTKRPINTQEDRNRMIREYRKTEVGKQKKQELDKKYREGDKREELLEKKREWSKQNREKINEKRGEVTICECGFTYTHGHKARHMKTQKHINNI